MKVARYGDGSRSDGNDCVGRFGTCCGAPKQEPPGGGSSVWIKHVRAGASLLQGAYVRCSIRQQQVRERDAGSGALDSPQPGASGVSSQSVLSRR